MNIIIVGAGKIGCHPASVLSWKTHNKTDKAEWENQTVKRGDPIPG